MTPNHPNIISLLQNASKWMMDNGMSPSLEGYQGDSKRVEEMVSAVYNAIKKRKYYLLKSTGKFLWATEN